MAGVEFIKSTLDIASIRSAQIKELLFELQGMAYIAGGAAREVIDPDNSPPASDIDLFMYSDGYFWAEPVDVDVFQYQGKIMERLDELGYRMTRDLPNALEFKKQGLMSISLEEFERYRTDDAYKTTLLTMHHPGGGSSYYKYCDLDRYMPVQLIKPFVNRLRPYTEWRVGKMRLNDGPPETYEVNHEGRVLMKTYGRPEDMMQLFDFTVAMAALEVATTELAHPDGKNIIEVYGACGLGYDAMYDPYSYLNPDCKLRPLSGISTGHVQAVYSNTFFEDNKAKKLIINHINCPVAVTLRVLKFYAKGYHIGTGQLIKLFQEWQERPEEYRKRLIELCTTENLDSRQFFELEELLRID